MLLVRNELLKFSVCKGYVSNGHVCKGSIGNVTISNEEWAFLGGDLFIIRSFYLSNLTS